MSLISRVITIVTVVASALRLMPEKWEELITLFSPLILTCEPNPGNTRGLEVKCAHLAGVASVRRAKPSLTWLEEPDCCWQPHHA